MEIEGIINHTLASALIEREYLAKQVAENQAHIAFWRDLQQINCNETVRLSLEGITHVRQILGSEMYMEDLIKKHPADPLYYMGYPLKTIEFYIHLKNEMSKNKPVESESKL